MCSCISCLLYVSKHQKKIILILFFKIHRIVHANVEKMLHAAVCRKHKKIVDNRQSLKHKL